MTTAERIAEVLEDGMQSSWPLARIAGLGLEEPLRVAAMYERDRVRAERLAEMADGERDLDLYTICTMLGARVMRGEAGARAGDYRFSWPDGSAIVHSGPAWDVASAAAGCDGWCWEGSHDHRRGCPLGAGDVGLCLYCREETTTHEVPAIGDDAAWARLASEHADGCDWIETRAHRVKGSVDA